MDATITSSRIREVSNRRQGLVPSQDDDLHPARSFLAVLRTGIAEGLQADLFHVDALAGEISGHCAGTGCRQIQVVRPLCLRVADRVLVGVTLDEDLLSAVV